MCKKRNSAAVPGFEVLEAGAMINSHPSTASWSNLTKTSRYTVWSFVPVNLFQQFRNFSNIYFLCAAVLQMIPGISDSNGQPLILIPLSFVLLTTALKDLLQDIKMHRSDAEENSRLCLRLRASPDLSLASAAGVLAPGSLHEDLDFDLVRWEEVRVGDLVKVKRGEPFPADLVLLLSSDVSGSAYVETKNLDGETNLKPKRVANALLDRLHSGQDVRSAFAPQGDLPVAVVTYEIPSPNLYKFEGELKLTHVASEASATEVVRVPLNTDQFLLRGSSLQTTKFIYGLVLYTGQKTRIFTNAEGSTTARYKITKLMRTYSTHVLVLFALQLLVCTFCAVASDISYASREDWYLEEPSDWGQGSPSGSTVATRGFKVFAALLLQFTYFVPISLLVSLELVKFAQAAFIVNDKRMVHVIDDVIINSRVNNSSLSEELGAVSHIYTDKTGTLTENLMLFAALWVMGAARDASIARLPEPTPDDPQDEGRDTHVHKRFSLAEFRRCVEEMDEISRARVRDLLVSIGVCHTVLIKPTEEASRPNVFRHPWSGVLVDSEDMYDASSPDELALVAGARYLGFEFTHRPSVDSLLLKLTTDFAKSLVLGGEFAAGVAVELEFRVQEVMEFDNDRKRMSVLVIRSENGPAVSESFAACWPAATPVLICKGADSSMVAVASAVADEDGEENADDLQFVLGDFAKMGLRTLVFGRRLLWPEPAWTGEWRKLYSLARGQVGEEKKRQVANCIEQIEKDLEILGCSGIEDKLQDGVPECIRNLHGAGIKLWILTGDKVETAINIGYACELLDEGVYNQIIDQPVAKLINEALDEAIMMADKKIKVIGEELRWNEQAEDELRKAGFRVEKSGVGSHFDVVSAAAESRVVVDDESDTEASSLPMSRVAITISGDALAVVFRHTELRNKFFRFALAKCTTVIACRVSPKQKADVVLYSGSYLPNNTMLAIGDGANDVGMIVMANVGVGVCGKEGQQAVRSADFAIGQFRFLERLLFLHGRETIRKNSQFLYYSIFKNVVFSIPIFFYALFAGFAPSNVYSAVLKQLYNIIYTMLPSMLYAVLDRELPTAVLARAPFLYKWPKQMFGLGVLAQWLGFAFWVGAWLLYGTVWSLAPYAVTSRGYGTVDAEAIGVVLFFLVVVIVNMYVYRISSALYTLTHAIIWTCTLSFVVSWVISNYTLNGIKGTLIEVGGTARGFGVLLLVTGGAFLPLALRHVYLALFRPSNARVARERVYVVKARELVEGKTVEERRKTQRKSIIAKSFVHTKYIEDSKTLPAVKTLIDDAEHGYAFTEDTGAERLGLYSSVLASSVPDDVPRSFRLPVEPTPSRRPSARTSGGPVVNSRV